MKATKSWGKIALLFFMVLINLKSFCQPYVQLQAGGKNIGLSFGVVSSNVLIDLGYTIPYNATDKPKIASLSIGRVIFLTNNDEDNFSVTPAIGFAYLSYKDFNKNIDGINVNEFKPIYKIELAKDWYHGRLFVAANYAKDLFFTVGIKAFIKND